MSNETLVQEASRKALNPVELAKTVERFRTLCRQPEASVADLDRSAEALRDAGYKQELMVLLHEALKEPGVNPHVGTLWIRRVVTSRVWDHRYPDGLDSLCRAGAAGRLAVIEFLRLAGTPKRADLVRRAIAVHKSWLRSDAVGWSVAVQALTGARCYSEAARWCSKWREQGNLDLATLVAIVKAFRAAGKSRDAAEALSKALDGEPTGDSVAILKLWSAQDLALAGEAQTASAQSKQVNPTGWDDDSLALYYLVRGVIRVQKASPESRSEAFLQARDRLKGLFRRFPIYKRDMYLRREYRRCVSRMARESGAVLPRIVCAWDSADSIWFALVLLVVPGLQLLLPCFLFRLCRRRRGLLK